jgi:hypothetical protein
LHCHGQCHEIHATARVRFENRSCRSHKLHVMYDVRGPALSNSATRSEPSIPHGTSSVSPFSMPPNWSPNLVQVALAGMISSPSSPRPQIFDHSYKIGVESDILSQLSGHTVSFQLRFAVGNTPCMTKALTECVYTFAATSLALPSLER